MGRIYQFTTPPTTIDFLNDFEVVAADGQVLLHTSNITCALEFAASVDGNPDVKQACRFFFPRKQPQLGWISVFAMEKA